jgi:hypothetical protein
MSLVSQWLVGVRIAVLPIMSVRWHSGHPYRNSGDRINDVSRNVCPSGIDTPARCEVGTEWGCRHGRTSITLPEVEPHRGRSDGTKAKAAVRTWEGSSTDLGSTTAAPLRGDRSLVNERASASLRTIVGLRTLG